MALLGHAALAMWWEVAHGVRDELTDWHAHEHWPERLAIPGFLRASRWTEFGGDGFFVLYELTDPAVLASAPYVARLNAPTPWSTRMMPLHRHMVRSQCRVLVSRGAMTGAHAVTLRCSAATAQAEVLTGQLSALAERAARQPGTVGLHVLRHEAPALAATTEQKIRGLADGAADWVIMVSGYDPAALQRWAETELADPALAALGFGPAPLRQAFTLAYTASTADLR